MIARLGKLRPGAVLKHRPVRDYAWMTAGVLVTAFGLDAFLIPNKIAAGGVSGLATIIYHLLKAQDVVAPVGVQMLFMNLVLLVVALRLRGWRFAAKTVFGIFALSLAIDLMAAVVTPMASNDRLLAALYGGAVTGLGLGMAFKAGGNTGGSDLIAQLVAPKVALGLGQLTLAVDAAVTLVAAVAFGPELALYGAVAIFVSGGVIDLVLEGLPVNKAAFIVSDHSDRIADAILNDLKRGATALQARGLYSGTQREMIFTVVARNEIDGLKEIVHSVDPAALLIISDVHEAIGEGFREPRV